MGTPILHLKGTVLRHKDRILCKDISLEICAGDCIMLCGANGCGKTTLLKTLAAMSCKETEIVMIPTRIPKVKGFTLKEFSRIGCFKQSDSSGRLAPDEEQALEDAMERLGLTDIAEQDISTLSDGEFQKAGIATALVRKADIIILDEPTAFLDVKNRTEVLSTLKELCSAGTASPAVIFSTHDLSDGLSVCTKIFGIDAHGRFHTEVQPYCASVVQRIFP